MLSKLTIRAHGPLLLALLAGACGKDGQSTPDAAPANLVESDSPGCHVKSMKQYSQLGGSSQRVWCSPLSINHDKWAIGFTQAGLLSNFNGTDCVFFLNRKFTDGDGIARCEDYFHCGTTDYVISQFPAWSGSGDDWMIRVATNNSGIVLTCPKDKTCPNGTCEPNKGEDYFNCPWDCKYVPSTPSCSGCLSGCKGTPGCCTGCGCLCEKSCGGCA